MEKIIEKLRAELQKVKQIRRKAKEKLTPEDLKKLPGYELLSLEKCAEILDTLREYARIYLTHLNNQKRISYECSKK